MRDGSPSGARRWAFDSGSTRSATARPRAAGTRPGPSRPGISNSAASNAHIHSAYLNLAPCVATFDPKDHGHASFAEMLKALDTVIEIKKGETDYMLRVR